MLAMNAEAVTEPTPGIVRSMRPGIFLARLLPAFFVPANGLVQRHEVLGQAADYVAGIAGQVENITKGDLFGNADLLCESSWKMIAGLGERTTRAVDRLCPLPNQTIAHALQRQESPSLAPFLIAMKRIADRVTALQIASASIASDFPHSMYGFAHIGGIRRTSLPKAISSRAQ